jgi:hypothetical protein
MNNNIGIDSMPGIKLNTTSSVEIICKDDMMTVSIDDVKQKVYIKPRMNARTTVYCGDPWYSPAQAKLENLCYTDLNAYDYNKVYQAGENINMNARPYSLKQYVGLAGYGPDRPGDQLWQDETPNYTYQGCYRDSGNRALPTNLPHVNSVQACYRQAKAGNYKVFGLQDNGQCWAGNNSDWGRYGKINADCGTLGGDWNNQIYTTL